VQVKALQAKVAALEAKLATYESPPARANNYGAGGEHTCRFTL
jgi:hypothetical protein